MGKYTRKFNAIGEVAAMELAPVGVRTRARALTLEAAAATTLGTAKRRKVVGGEKRELRYAPTSTTRRHVITTPENSVSPAISQNQGALTEDRCSSPCSNGDDYVTASCCSSNGSSEGMKDDDLKFMDLEDESIEGETSTQFDGRESNETTTASSKLRAVPDGMESTSKHPEKKSCGRSTTAEKMPSEAEIEEFFAAAEKDILKRFTEKYNFDFVKDVPREGRYEWVRLNP